jgi:hypothetical protein
VLCHAFQEPRPRFAYLAPFQRQARAVAYARIEAVARELFDRSELDGGEVARLLGPVGRMPFKRPSFKPAVADQVLHRDGYLRRSYAQQGADHEFSGPRNARLVERAMRFHMQMAARRHSF